MASKAQPGTVPAPDKQEDQVASSLRPLTARGIDQTTVLRRLGIGFLVVILLLAMAAFLSVSRSRTIHNAAAELLRQERISSAVVDELQFTHQHMSTLLLQLFDEDHPTRELRRRTDSLEAAVRRVTADGARIQPHPAWPKVREVGLKFAEMSRQLLVAPPGKRDDIETSLEDLRTEFSRLSGDIVRGQAGTAAQLEDQIEQQSVDLTQESAWLLGTCLLLSIAGAAVTIRIAQQSLRTMRWQAEELNRVSWHMLQNQETAARRFSHEMHDELGQVLTGLKANLIAMTPEEFGRRRQDSMNLLDEAIAKTRELSQLLHPVILDDFGIEAALRWVAERFSERTGIEVECESSVRGRLAEGTETHLFRIAQEALTNVARHSGATKASILLTESGGGVRLVVEDNGRGLKAEAAHNPGLGMVGMRARARQIGGELKVARSRAGGVKVEINAPRREAETDGSEKDASAAS